MTIDHLLFLNRDKKLENIFAHCRHILELDYLRAHLPVSNKKVRKNLLCYTIKYLEPNYTKKERERYFNIPHLFFLDNLRTGTPREKKYIGPSPAFMKPVQNYLALYDIPPSVRDNQLLEINKTMPICRVLESIKCNIRKMQHNSRNCVLYTMTYYLLMKELVNFNHHFREDERDLVLNIHSEISMFFLYVKESATNKTISEEHEQLVKTNENERQRNINIEKSLNSITGIELDIDTSADYYSEIVDVLNSESCEVLHDKIIRVESKSAADLLAIYSKLIEIANKNKKKFIPVLSISQNTNVLPSYNHEMHNHASQWAYVFYRLYGANVSYSDEKNLEVNAIIEISKKTNISVDFFV